MIAMKYCRKTWAVGWLSVFTLIPLGVILWITSFRFLIDLNLVSFILLLLTGIFLLWLGKMEYSFEARKYLITPEGLFLGNKRKVFYAWEQIYEIGVYPFDAAASLEVYDKVICCSLVPPPANFKHDLFHNPRFYAQRNPDKFVIIDYDEATISALSKVYPKSIMNYMEGKKGYIRNNKLRRE